MPRLRHTYDPQGPNLYQVSAPASDWTGQSAMEGRHDKLVYLRADERLRYGKVIEVVDRIKQAGVEQIGFVYVLPQEKVAQR